MVNGGWLEVKVVITFECLFNHRAYCLNSNFKELGECTEFKTPKVILPIPKIRSDKPALGIEADAPKESFGPANVAKACVV
jgi:hypothetical protein